MQFEFHPLANLFPLIEGEEFDDLVADVTAHGINQPIDIYQGKILDGRNRYRAAGAAGLDVEARNVRYFRPEMSGDPLEYVLSQNLKRRHLNESQRALIAAKISTLKPGRPAENAQNCAIPQDAAAGRVNVSRRLVQSAAVVRDHGSPEILRAVERGKMSISAAAMAARLGRDRQAMIAARAEAGDEGAARTIIKQDRRDERERALAEEQQALPTKKYGVILADPEWRFEPWSRATGLDRSADNHYPTSCTEVIAARDVPSIAARDCVLFLWATVPMLPHALLVMAAWGFDYRSHLIWHKDRLGTGYWFRNAHELLLVGVKGNIPAPAMGTQAPSLIAAALGAHSEKPEAFHALIEQYFPTLPKIELNRRGPPRPGWSAWGNEAESQSESLPPHDPDTGEIIASQSPAPDSNRDEEMEIPAFLRRTRETHP